MFLKHYDQLRPKGTQNAAELLTQVDKEFTEFAPVLKIAAPKRDAAGVLQRSPGRGADARLTAALAAADAT